MASSFSDVLDEVVAFSDYEVGDDVVDFVPTGDFGAVTTTIGWGDGEWGNMPWGGTSTTILTGNTTIWTNIDTP